MDERVKVLSMVDKTYGYNRLAGIEYTYGK